MHANKRLSLGLVAVVAAVLVGLGLNAAFGTPAASSAPHEDDGWASHDGYKKESDGDTTVKDSFNEDKTKDSFNQDNDKKVTKDSYNKDIDKNVMKDSYNQDNDKKVTKDSYNPEVKVKESCVGDDYTSQECGNDEAQTTTTNHQHWDDHSIDQDCKAVEQPERKYEGYETSEKPVNGGAPTQCTIDASHYGRSECNVSGFINVVQCPGQVEGDNTQSTNIRNEDGGAPYQTMPVRDASTSDESSTDATTTEASTDEGSSSLLANILSIL